MKRGIISDIHGNYHALLAVAKDMEQEGIEQVWCLGDIVNYGAFPNECINWISENASFTVLGNHELMLLGFSPIETGLVGECLKWTKREILPEHIEFLKTLPLKAEIENIILVHDDPLNPGSMHYIIYEQDAENVLLKLNKKLCFFGHSHIAGGFKLSSVGAEFIKFNILNISTGKFLINPGSVGQPRDKDPRASYAIFEDNTIRIKRVEYNVKEAARSIIDAGLPTFMAVRLLKGI